MSLSVHICERTLNSSRSNQLGLREDGRPLKRILIVKLSSLGDVVMTLPSLMALRNSFPQAKIDWMVEPANVDILSTHPMINSLLVSTRPEAIKLIKKGRLLQGSSMLFSFIKDLRRERYDAVLDFHGLFKSAAFVFWASSKRKIGFAKSRELSSFPLTEKLPPYDRNLHAVLRYLTLAQGAGGVLPAGWESEPFFDPGLEAEKEAQRLLAPLGGAPFAAMAPAARWVTKIWPLYKWAELIKLLAGPNLKAVILGGPAEHLDGLKLAAQSEHALSLAGLTRPKVLAAILKNSAIMLGPDSGPIHLAAAVGAGGLALYAPTEPKNTSPFGGRFELVRPQLDCLACLKRRCPISPDNCLGRLGAQEVAQRATIYLEQSR